MAGETQLLGADEILIEQTDVGLDAYGHPGIDAGLEFEQQIDVEPVLALSQSGSAGGAL